MPPQTDRERVEALRRSLWRLSGLGIELIGAIVALMAIGWLLDRWLKTSPWFFVGGAVVGIVGGLFKAVREASAAERGAQEDQRRERERRDKRGG
jgi:F0F1-type ATP synthase assembly protein I